MQKVKNKRDEKEEKLINSIQEAVEDNINNKGLLKALKEEFIQKRLPETIPNQLFADAIDEEHLEKNELIAITKVFREELQDDRFKLSNYFTESEIFSYNHHIRVDNPLQYILMKSVKQIDNKNYLGVMSGEQAYEIRKNSLYAYYKEFQRSPRLVKTSSGRFIKKIDANIKNILDMEEEFKGGKMTPTSIHFAVLVKNTAGIKENFKFKPMYEDIGDIWIKPNFDSDSKTYLPFMCIDGWHRFTAMCNAVERAKIENYEIKAELGCFIHVFENESDIKKFIVSTFKRCDTNLDYLNAINPTDENSFIDKFIKECNWLNGHTALTKQEMRIEHNYTEKRILLDSFKKTNVEMNDDLENELSREKIANIIDETLDYVLKNLYDGDLEKMMDSIYLNKYIFNLYIKFASEVKERKYKADIYHLVQYIKNNYYEVANIFKEKYISDGAIDLILREVIE